jgi:hypothetical protein
MNNLNLIRRAGIVIFAGAVSALALTSGCTTAATGAGPAFVEGNLVTTVPNGLDKTALAVNAVPGQLSLTKVSEDRQPITDILVARNSSDTRIEIRLETIGDGVTKVTIRVGAAGDQPLSLAILDRIKANL